MAPTIGFKVYLQLSPMKKSCWKATIILRVELREISPEKFEPWYEALLEIVELASNSRPSFT